MARTPKSKGAAKEAYIEPEASVQPNEPIEHVEEIPERSDVPSENVEVAEEAQPLPFTPLPDLRNLNDIYVRVSPFSSAYKKLAAEQRKNDPSMAQGAIMLMGKEFSPNKNYQVKETPEVNNHIKEGLLICMSGSFKFKSTEGT